MTEHEDDDGWVRKDGVWERFLFSLVLLLLFAVGQNLVWVVALIQFLWMLFAGKPNHQVAAFGARLAIWLKKTVFYLSGMTDEKPFPWAEID